MKFDKSKVYTALTADELQPGDIVIVADTITELKGKLSGEFEGEVLTGVLNEEWYGRFEIGNNNYALAYLVEKKENCTNCEGCEYKDKEWMKKNKNYLINRCENYKPKTNINLCDSCKHCFADCPATPDDIVFGDGVGNDNVCACDKYEQKAEKNYRPFRDVDELIKVWEKKWSDKTNGQKWHDCKLNMPHIWVQTKNSYKTKLLITEYEQGRNLVTVYNDDYDMEDLFKYFEFLDGSPCGVEE